LSAYRRSGLRSSENMSIRPSHGVYEPAPSEPVAGAAPDGSDLSLAAGVARSGLWAIGGQISVLAATLIAAPFTIRLLGPARYGLWSLLQSVLAYFRLADLGMATASTKFAADRYARNDSPGEATVIWTALAVTVTLTGAAALAAAIAAPFLVSHVLHVRSSLRSEAVLAFRLVSVAAVAYAVSASVSTPQQVRLRWGSLTVATSGPVVLQIAAAPILLAVTAGGLPAVAALMTAAGAAAAVLNFAVGTRLQPGLRRPRLAPGVLAPLVRYGGALAIFGFAAIPLATAERFLLAHFRSPTVVAYYVVAAALGSLLAVVPAAVSQPVLPALARLASQARMVEYRRLYHQVLRGVFLVVTPAALVLAFVAQPFLGLWAGSAYAAHSVVPFYVLLAGLWFSTLGYMPASQLLASGRTSTLAAINLVELLPYLCVAALLTNSFGAVGAAAAWTFRATADSLVLFLVVGRRDGLPWMPTPRRANLALTAVACIAGLLWGLSAVTSSLAARGLLSVLVMALYATLMWKAVLTPEERHGLARLTRLILSGRAALRLSVSD
jgi:O-antigen/teichoic acid export membrane protein